MRAIVEGTIFRTCERKSSKGGKEYAAATIKTGSGQDLQFVHLAVFSSTVIEQLEALAEGDAVAVKGELKVAGSVSVGNSGAIDYLHGQVSFNACITPRASLAPQLSGCFSAQFLNA